MVTILIVEDDEKIRRLIRTQLSGAYRVLEAGDGEQALDVLDHEAVDLLIVDIMMPRMDGHELVRTLREGGDMRPVIMLTAMLSFDHKKTGFAEGVDDYMTKPIHYEELLWRIEALLRRARIADEKRITLGGFTLSATERTARLDGREIPLTNKEFDLLYKLLSYPNVVFTKQQLMDAIWGMDSETEYDTIKTYVSRLRSKFADCGEFELIAIRGLGYKAVIRGKEARCEQT